MRRLWAPTTGRGGSMMSPSLAALLQIAVVWAGFITQASCAIPPRCQGITPTKPPGGALRTPPPRQHGDTIFSAAQISAVERQIEAWKAARTSATVLPYMTQVPVYVHVISATGGIGNVTDKAIVEQIAELNRNYHSTLPLNATNPQFNFTLVKVDRYVNTNWHLAGHYSAEEDQAKQRSRIGGFGVLNFWVAGPTGGYLGWGTFPFDGDRLQDGIWINYKTLPGGTLTRFNLGRTATHEVGHWLGLYHVFQGGCYAPGDEVADTPPQDVAFGCYDTADSCPGSTRDSISNYMQYTDDCCMQNFTPLQRQRMRTSWGVYRAGI